ncbi:MAG TPA: hypothetical protein VIU34_29355 [Steroidobacter sp.]
MRYKFLARCVVSAAAGLIAGCASQSAATRASAQCGAVVGGVSFLACKLKGKTDEHCLKLAGVGVAAGAVGCYVYASSLESRRKALAGNEHDLDAQIDYVKGLNTDTEQLNADLAKRLSQVTQETDALVAKVQQQQISEQQLLQERQSLENTLNASQKEVSEGQGALQFAKQLRAKHTNQSVKLDDAITQQEKLLAQAQTQVNLLAAQKARV